MQTQFRILEVSDHVYKLKKFWKKPDGPLLVSRHFEWLTGGSVDGWLQATIEMNLDTVLSIVCEIISRKKGELWLARYNDVVHSAEIRNGNSTMVWVFLLREWSKMYKEKPHRIIFIEGEDPIEDVSNQPHVHVRKVKEPGLDFDERVTFSLKCGGHLIIFEDLSLCAALASLVEVCFIFHVEYDKEADSISNFIQRTLCRFGDEEGAQNKMGKVKRSFLNFQAAFGKIMLDKNMGSIKKILTQ